MKTNGEFPASKADGNVAEYDGAMRCSYINFPDKETAATWSNGIPERIVFLIIVMLHDGIPVACICPISVLAPGMANLKAGFVSAVA